MRAPVVPMAASMQAWTRLRGSEIWLLLPRLGPASPAHTYGRPMEPQSEPDQAGAAVMSNRVVFRFASTLTMITALFGVGCRNGARGVALNEASLRFVARSNGHARMEAAKFVSRLWRLHGPPVIQRSG